MANLFRRLLIAGAGFRWIWAKIRIGLGARAKPTKATAQSTAAAAAEALTTQADATVRPVADGIVRQGVTLGVRARLQAHKLAIGRVALAVATAARSVIISIPSVVAAAREGWATAVRAAATTGEAVIAQDVEKTVSLGVRADGNPGRAVMPAAGDTLGMVCEAKPQTGGAVTGAASEGVGLRTYARPITWADPEVVDGVLILRQVYAAEVKNGVLEVR